MTGDPLFSDIPILPVVPLPVPGEALGGWIAAIARTYRLTLAEYLRRLGVPCGWVTAEIERDLVVGPVPLLMKRLQADTGISEHVLRRMTFTGLDRDLEEACQHHNFSCTACADEASQRAGRPVSLLHARAVWRVTCPDHPPCLKPAEMEADIPLASFYDQLQAIITFLDWAVYDYRSFETIVGRHSVQAITAGSFVRFVYLLNAYLSVRVIEFDALRDLAGFRILRAFSTNENGEPAPLPPDERNNLAASLVLAWQLVKEPLYTLLAGVYTFNPIHHKSAQDATQFIALMHLIIEFLPGEMLAPLVIRGALSRQGPDSDGVHTALALAMTKHWSNDPSYSVRLAEAGWNHAACSGLLLGGGLTKRKSNRLSRFPIAGPFRYQYAAADTKPAGLISQARQEVWRKRNWDTRAGLNRFLARPKSLKPSKKQPPTKRVVFKPQIAKAVKFVLETHGPVTTSNLGARQRRILLRKLLAEAMKHLNQEAFPGMSAGTFKQCPGARRLARDASAVPRHQSR